MMFLIVGLGNPGNEYQDTRHNVGFMAIDSVVYRHSFRAFSKKFHGQWATGTVAGQKCAVLKPETFMNKSGVSVSEAVRFFKIPPENVIILYDELDLPVGKLRVKSGGGNGGHNGLRSIDSHMDKNYTRVRIGIDHPGEKSKVSGYVLGRFSKDQTPVIDMMCDEIARNIELLLEKNSGEFMNKISLNVKK